MHACMQAVERLEPEQLAPAWAELASDKAPFAAKQVCHIIWPKAIRMACMGAPDGICSYVSGRSSAVHVYCKYGAPALLKPPACQ